ncbi:hypothetical protein [Spirillospora sp. NPDC029432]|uniref:hypothetical protein n=1 Tax=Spirillospora sp. NPDC029432 TaxID=3154599 RepID=UPI0034535EB1
MSKTDFEKDLEVKEPEAREPEAKEPEAKGPEAKGPEAREPEAKEPEDTAAEEPEKAAASEPGPQESASEEKPEADGEQPPDDEGEKAEKAAEDGKEPDDEDGEKKQTKKKEESKTGERPAPPDGKRKAAMALAVVAAVCAAWFGWSWYAAAHDDSLGFSRERDEVLRAGEQAVQNLNTLDHRSLDQGLKLWQDSSTSELYQEIVQGRPQFEKAVRKAQTITSAKVLDAAVTELDQHAGKASVIVGLQITVTPPKGEPAVKKTRLMGQLTRTSTGWKLSALSQAPVGGAG